MHVMTCNVHVMHVITCNNILGVSLMPVTAANSKPSRRAQVRSENGPPDLRHISGGPFSPRSPCTTLSECRGGELQRGARYDAVVSYNVARAQSLRDLLKIFELKRDQ
jgi:hypothetical protein